MSKLERIIWTNNDYNEWKESMLDEGETEVSYERYCDDCELLLDDERCNLNVNVDGYIMVFASIGTWCGIQRGIKIVGNNVRDILCSECDYVTWYCDRYNVRCNAIHHDGTNHYLYRVVESKEKAEWLITRMRINWLDEKQFMRATKSLRPYVAKVYGW